MRWTGRLVAILLVAVPATLVAVVGGSAAAGSGPSPADPIVLQLKFGPVGVPRLIAGCGQARVLTSGRYTVESTTIPSPTCASRFVLIDDRTGKHRVIRAGGFTNLEASALEAFGAPWVFIDSSSGALLYNIDTKKTHICDPSRCERLKGASYNGSAVGSRWLETFVQQPGPCGDGVHNDCGPVTESFYNIKTGQVRQSPSSNSTKVADLNSRRLFHRVCSPLRVPATPTGSSGMFAEPPSLTFYGPFAIARGFDGVFLERCGSNLKMPIGVSQPGGPLGLVFANTHIVMWQVLDDGGFWHGQFAGVLLPSLRPFTATVPPNLTVPVALSAYRLYVEDASGRLWAATTPR